MTGGGGVGGDLARAGILINAQEDARREVLEPTRRLDRTEDQLRQLLLVTEALWSLVSEKVGITQAELAQRMAEIDAQDGHVDNQRGPHPPEPCPTCGAAIDRTRSTCAFCGDQVAPTNPFDRI